MLSLFNRVSILFEEQKITCINIFLLEPTFNEDPPHINTCHLCRTPPPNFLVPPTPPHDLFDTEEHKVVIELGPIKKQKLSFGQYTKCPSKHFKTYFKNLASV